MGKIILAIAFFTMGVAAGYTWRDRISKARRAKERERQRQLTAENESKTSALLRDLKSLH
jgi:hypothetical protein